MIHQNYLSFINNDNNKTNFNLIFDISDSLSFGDLIENYIYSKQYWMLHDVHCFFMCINSSYTISKQVKMNKFIKLEFPNDLNKTSIKKINNKNIINANVFLENMNIGDLINVGTLTKKLINDNKIDECAKKFINYDANQDTIKSVLKIDKIDICNKQPLNVKKIFNKQF